MLGRFKAALETQCDELYITSWKDLFPETFKYPEKTIIRNKVVASANKILQLTAIICLVFFFFVDEEYMEVYVPNVHGKFWASKSDFELWADEMLTGTPPEYCNNSDYNWVYPGNEYYQYVEAKCVVPMFFEMFLTSESTMFFLTYFHESTVTQRPCESISENTCAGDYSQWYFDRDILNKTCKCETISNHFTVGVEDIKLVLEHSYTVTGLPYSGKDETMLTVVRDYNGKEVAVPDGSIAFSIGQWLEWGGVNLDDYNMNVENYSEIHPTVDPTEKPPRIRQTGVTVNVELKYFNMQRFQEKWRGPNTVAYVDISAVGEWQTRESNVRYLEYPSIPLWNPSESTDIVYSDSMKLVNRYSYGALFSISDSGYIGAVDFDMIKAYFVDVVCIVGYIPMMMAIVASAFFGFKSEIYRGQLNHHLDGEMKKKEHFRKVFKYLFKNYWKTSSYSLTFEEWHIFCEDRNVPLDDELAIREECIFQKDKHREKTKILTAKMFFLALDDPDPDGVIDNYWEQWDCEYRDMKQEQHLIELAKFSNTIYSGMEHASSYDLSESSSEEFPDVRGVVYKVEGDASNGNSKKRKAEKNKELEEIEEEIENLKQRDKEIQNQIKKKTNEIFKLQSVWENEKERLKEIEEAERKKIDIFLKRLAKLENSINLER